MNNKIFITIFFVFIVLFSFSACGSNPRNNESELQLTPEESLVVGQKFYHLRGCIKCHGRDGKGDGYKSLYLPPDQVPQDFREFNSYKQGYDLESIIFTIKNGITNRPPVIRRGLSSLFFTNVASSTGMPAYPHLTYEEISHIARYVLYLQTNQY